MSEPRASEQRISEPRAFERWRPVVAALAEPVRRAVYASVVLGVEADVPAKQRDRALAALVRMGMITGTADGYAVNGALFAQLLDADPQPTKTGVDRFLRDGRITGYPARPADRAEILAWAAERVIAPNEALTEREINERLALLVADFASLRRYLVDAGLLERDADGASYRRGNALLP